MANDNLATKTNAQIVAILNNYIVTDADGSQRLKDSELMAYLSEQFGYYTNSQTNAITKDGRAYEIVNALKRIINRENWQSNPAYPRVGANTSATARSRLIQIQSEMIAEAQAFESRYRQVAAGLSARAKSIYSTVVAPQIPAGDELITEARTYIYTYVTDWGEESAPSPAADVKELNNSDTMAITIPAPPTGRKIVAVRLYRSATGTQSSAYQFQGEYPASVLAYSARPLLTTQTIVTDDKKQEFLGEVCPTFGWIEPPAGLTGLVAMPNGVMLGFSGRTLHACEPYAPYAWPAKYDIPLDFDIVGIVVFGQSAFVATKGTPYIVSGADSATLSAEKIAANQAGVSMRSMVAVGGSVIYATPDGIAIMENGQVTVVTEGILSKEKWQEYNPASIRAAEFEGRYYAFYTKADTTKGCLVLDYQSRTLIDMDQAADAVFSDRSTDTLYLLDGTAVKNVFPAAGSNRTGIWKSGVRDMGAPVPMAWLHVDSTFLNGATPVDATVRIYGDGVLRHAAVVSNTRPVRLPSGRYTEWQVEVESSAPISSVVLASTTDELKAA
jgi:hypothetical protein